MNKFSRQISAILAVCLFAVSVFAQSSVDQRQVNEILSNINIKIDDFQYNVNDEVNRGAVNQTDETKISDSLKDLRDDLDGLRDNIAAGRDSQDDVRQILDTARAFNDYLLRLRLNAKSQNDWKAVRNLLDQLASKFGVSTSWNTSANSQTNANYGNNNLTGTYQLDVSRSDNTREIANEAINNSNAQNRDQARQDLEEKLEAPQQLAIDLRGNQVTLASTLANQITVSTDGRDRNETLSDGSTLRLRGTLRGTDLIVSSLGNNVDYTVTFTSMDNGKGLKVTRRITTDYLSQTVFAESFYTKSDSLARLDIFGDENNNSTNTSGNYPSNTGGNYPPPTTATTNNPPATRTPRNGQYIVPNGEIITGTLENDISTKVSQNNDRFRMRVTAPNQYRGAIIEGYVSGIDRSNRNPVGTSKLTLNFETIRLSNGQTYDFAGFLQSITDVNGKNVKVDEEGTISKSSTKDTIRRGGIGAGAGAIIGGIFGGVKGAIIGATIGAGAGAGTVAIQNKGDLELKSGSAITVQSSAPNP